MSDKTIHESLRDDYYSGEFDRLKNDLEHFINRKYKVIRNNVDKIRQLPELVELGARAIVEMATKELILDCWVIHPQEDAKAQIEAIEKHLWLVGEKMDVPPDRDVEIASWIIAHAGKWREYRLLAILFVFHKNLEHYFELLKDTGEFEELRDS